MRSNIGSERLIALTDGVVAVIITIMVLELKPPHGANFASLREIGLTFLSFVLSFVYVAIYWNNHHHFFRLVPHVGGSSTTPTNVHGREAAERLNLARSRMAPFRPK